MKTETKNKCKAAMAIIGYIIGAAVIAQAVIFMMWAADAAGIPM